MKVKTGSWDVHAGKSRAGESRTQGQQQSLPLIVPEPPRLSLHAAELAEIEDSGIYSNYGPVNAAFERELIEQIFGSGECVTVCNATIGLMIAIREVIGEAAHGTRRYALMPSFTFAATAQAAMWCGLTPLFCDVDGATWLPDAASEDALLKKYAGEIAVVIPYATFGNNLDLERYQRLSEEHRVPIVVDAAASLGSLDRSGKAFGAAFAWPVVFSMHATKVFSVGEGGLLYCRDKARIARLRCMGSFGFSQERSATCLGLNSKLSEVGALTARLQLERFPTQVAHRELLAEQYAEEFGGEYETQQQQGVRQARAFQSVLLPPELAPLRREVLRLLREVGVGAGCYFSPHLAAQPFFGPRSESGELPATVEVSSRIVSLPLTTRMNAAQVSYVVRAFRAVCDGLRATPDVSVPLLPESERHSHAYVSETKAA